ncbi:MAG: ABC transporter permease [bacterium]
MHFYPVLWREILAWKHEFGKIFLTSIIGPLLYLITFGWGLGRAVPMGGVNYLDFVLPGVIALSSLTSSYNSISTDLNIRRIMYKTFEQYVLAPLSITGVVLGEVIAGMLRGLFSCSLIIALGYIFGAQFQLSLQFLLVLLISCFGFSSLGVTAAMLCSTHREMAMFSGLCITPMSFLAGTFFSVNALPELIKQGIWFLPLTPVSHTLRTLALGGSLEMKCFSAVCIWASVFWFLAVIVTNLQYQD